MAKTHLSLSADPTAKGVPTGRSTARLLPSPTNTPTLSYPATNSSTDPNPNPDYDDHGRLQEAITNTTPSVQGMQGGYRTPSVQGRTQLPFSIKMWALKVSVYLALEHRNASMTLTLCLTYRLHDTHSRGEGVSWSWVYFPSGRHNEYNAWPGHPSFLL